MKKDKEEKQLKKESKKKIDKTRLATQIIAGLMAFFMIVGFAASLIYYVLRMVK